MTLHLVRLQPELRWLARMAQEPGLRDTDHDPGYLWHLALRRTFGAVAPQPFRIFEPGSDTRQRQPLHLLGYAPVDAAALRAARAETAADAGQVFPESGIASKPMPDAFTAGRILAFSTRVCPIVRTLSSDGSKKRELDAYVHEASARPEAPKPDRAEIYRDWLRRRLQEGGAELLEARLSSFRLASLVRRTHASPTGRTSSEEGAPKRLLAQRARAAARRPDATMDGLLEVRDPRRFQTLLARGVGRHRAFGFGLLLLRPAG